MQLWLRWVITEPNGVRRALNGERKLPFKGPHTEPKSRLLDWIVEASPVSRERRLDVYAEAYFARLCENLQEDFETSFRILGEDRFRGLVSAYLAAHPSRVYSAAGVGRYLSKFVASHLLSQTFPYLKDLMRLEWLTVETFYARDGARLDPSRLSGVPKDRWPTIVFGLDPAVRLMRASYNVDALWSDEKAEPCRGLRWILVSRLNHDIKVEVVSRRQYQVLRWIAARLTLGEICGKLEEELKKSEAASAPPLMDWFRDWLTNGVVTVEI